MTLNLFNAAYCVRYGDAHVWRIIWHKTQRYWFKYCRNCGELLDRWRTIQPHTYVFDDDQVFEEQVILADIGQRFVASIQPNPLQGKCQW